MSAEIEVVEVEEVEFESTREVTQRWRAELELAKRKDEKWIRRGRRIVKRYRDERNQNTGGMAGVRFNILWSNVQTLLPATYAKPPKAEAERRNKDNDPIARCASEILERCLQYEIDHYPDFDEALRGAALDRLLPGRGTVWVRYEQKEVDVFPDPAMPVDPMAQPQIKECSPTDYVFWEDFRCSPARVWGEVTWVARRVYLSRDELESRFGEEMELRGLKVSQIPLVNVPVGIDQLKEDSQFGDTECLKKAEVWEIWDKKTKRVYWVAEGYDELLDYKDDPYGLDGFWPIPKPLLATQTTDTITPVADYTLYQDQAIELDNITRRIGLLVQAVKVSGVYDASATGVERMLSESAENTLIPVSNWGAFSEKGGIKGLVDWMPLEQVIKALNECYMAREQTKQVIYEVTGISDIIRGSTQASETATAQNIKRQFGSLRLRPRQQDMAMFASEILRIKAQLMMDIYSPETLVAMSGIMDTYDRQYVEQAIALMKSEPMRAYRVEVAADSLVELDQEQEKQSRMEFLGAASGFLRQAVPAAEQNPALAPVLGEMLMFGVRAFKGGREMEGVFQQFVDQMSQPQDKPDPAMQKMQAEMQQQQQKMQMDMQIKQMQMQVQLEGDRAKAQAQLEVEMAKARMQAEVDINRQRAEAEQHALKMQNEAELQALRSQLDQVNELHQLDFQRWKAELDAAVKVQVAEIGAEKGADNAATAAATNEIASEVRQ